MTTFAVTDPQHTLSALNYVISNLGSATGVYANNVLTVDNVTNQVTVGVGGEIYSYNVQWLNIRYATNATGTQGFSTSPTNAGYYGLQATSDQYPSTISDPGYYTWNQVAGGFGTTNFLFYQTPGGRQITFSVANTAPNANFLVVGDGTPVDLDIVTTTFIANSVITGNNIVAGTITGNLIAANTITSVNIANGTITGNDIALYTIQANNIANGVIAVSNVSNGTSNITIQNNGNINFSVNGVSNIASVRSAGISTSGNVTGNLLFGFTISSTGTVYSNNAVVTNSLGANFIGANTVSATGNVYATNFIGNISGNIDAAGSNTEIQFNTTGDLLGANANFTYDYANNVMTVNGGNILTGNVSATGNINANGFNSTGNITITGGALRTTANTAFVVNTTATTVSIGGAANIAMNVGNSAGNTNVRGNVTIGGANVSHAVNGNTLTINSFAVFNAGANIGGANGLNVNSGNIVISSGNLTMGGANGIAYFKSTAATGVLLNTSTTVLIGNQSSNTGNAIFSGNILGNLAISATGNITTAVNMKSSYQLLTPVTFASLPAVVNGARAFITDGNLSAINNFGNTVSGGGGNTTPVWSDGSNWYIG